MNEIIEGNTLIAEFMGGKVVDSIFICNESTETYAEKFLHRYNIALALYDSSWDWLMPVVEKINDLGFRTEIHNNSTLIFHDVKLDEIINPPYGYGEQDKWIDITWKAVVDFIKWYNENVKT